MARIKAIIYDMDNTLVARNTAFFKTLNSAIQAVKSEIDFGIPTSEEIIEVQKRNLPFEKIFPVLFPNPAAYQNTVSLAEIILERYRQIAKTVPYEGTPFGVETITKIKKDNILQIVVTNRTNLVLERLKEAGYPEFDLIYPLPSKNEKPVAFQDLLIKLKAKNIEKEQVLSVGDHVDDYLFSKQIGIEFIAILQGLNTREEFIAAGLAEDNILKDLEQLISRII